MHRSFNWQRLFCHLVQPFLCYFHKNAFTAMHLKFLLERLLYSVSQKSSPLKLFAIFSLVVNLCN